jgi:hypothetical protein
MSSHQNVSLSSLFSFCTVLSSLSTDITNNTNRITIKGSNATVEVFCVPDAAGDSFRASSTVFAKDMGYSGSVGGSDSCHGPPNGGWVCKVHILDVDLGLIC